MLLDVSSWTENPLFPNRLEEWTRIIYTAVMQYQSNNKNRPRTRGNQYAHRTNDNRPLDIQQFIDAKMLIHVKTEVVNDVPYDIYKIRDAKMVKVTNHPKYGEFINGFNKITGKGARGDKQSKAKFAEAYEKYGLENILKALYRAKNFDQYHRENNMLYLTPEYILRDKIIDRYLSMPSRDRKTTPQFSGNA